MHLNELNLKTQPSLFIYFLSDDYFTCACMIQSPDRASNTNESKKLHTELLRRKHMAYVSTLISFSNTECTYPININTIRALSVGIDGDISFNQKKKWAKLHFKSPTAERRHASCVGGWRGSNPRRLAPKEQGMPALTFRLLRAS